MIFPVSRGWAITIDWKKGGRHDPEPIASSSNRGTQSRPANGSKQKDEWRIACARLLWTRSIAEAAALVKPFRTAFCVPSRSFTPCYEHLRARLRLPIRSIAKPLRINDLHRRRGGNFATCETQFTLCTNVRHVSHSILLLKRIAKTAERYVDETTGKNVVRTPETVDNVLHYFLSQLKVLSLLKKFVVQLQTNEL